MCVCRYCDEIVDSPEELVDHVSDKHSEEVTDAFLGLGVNP